MLRPLRGASVAKHEGQLLLFPWVGERRQQALILALARDELGPAQLGVIVSVSAEKESALVETLARLAGRAPPDALELAGLVENKGIGGFVFQAIVVGCFLYWLSDGHHLMSGPKNVSMEILVRVAPLLNLFAAAYGIYRVVRYASMLERLGTWLRKGARPPIRRTRLDTPGRRALSPGNDGLFDVR